MKQLVMPFKQLHVDFEQEQSVYSGLHSQEKKYMNPQTFIFPSSSEGLESVSSVFELMCILEGKFKKAFKNHPQIKCEYQYSFPRFYSYVQGLQYIKLVAHCKFCSHKLVYFKNLSFQQSYKLIAFRKFHVHTKDPKKIREIYVKTYREAPRVYRYQPHFLKMLRVEDLKKNLSLSVEEYVRGLPFELKAKTKFKLVHQRYGINDSQFDSLMRKINEQYLVTLKQFFSEMNEQNIKFAYAPKNILEAQQNCIKQVYKQQNISLMQYLERQSEENIFRSIHFFDQLNPNLPNILVIVTPHMKELYREYGQYVGFDLTFSIIRERPTHHKEYLVGAFCGTNESKRMMVFGLVLTNNQSVQAYKFMFTQFFKLVGSSPLAMFTDEEKAMFYALKQLKKEGIFKGTHLFDLFHILKKFRKASDGNCFQLYRRILHTTNRAEYRKIFRQLINKVSSDKQVAILRLFDANAQKYCYSQIAPSFVGTNLSTGMNQNFHNILKSNLPYEVKYVKAVKILMSVSKELNQFKQPDLEMTPYEETLNIPLLKENRTNFSRSIFKIIVKEVSRSSRYNILTEMEENRANLVNYKIEGSHTLSIKKPKLEKDHYFVQAENGIFKVFKKTQQNILNDKQSKSKGKWHCQCQYQQRSGVLCSHLAKILIFLDLDLRNNMNGRWMIKQHNITKRLLNYKYVADFLSLRSRYKVKVKGYKKRKPQPMNFNTKPRDDKMDQGEEEDNLSLSTNEMEQIVKGLNFQGSQSDMDESESQSMRDSASASLRLKEQIEQCWQNSESPESQTDWWAQVMQ